MENPIIVQNAQMEDIYMSHSHYMAKVTFYDDDGEHEIEVIISPFSKYMDFYRNEITEGEYYLCHAVYYTKYGTVFVRFT